MALFNGSLLPTNSLIRIGTFASGGTNSSELSAFVNERSGRVLFVLTLVTVLALPINLVAGLLGMNVGGIPFAESASGFAIIVTLLILLTAVLGYQVVTRLRD